jgi:hypothetical protein
MLVPPPRQGYMAAVRSSFFTIIYYMRPLPRLTIKKLKVLTFEVPYITLNR